MAIEKKVKNTQREECGTGEVGLHPEGGETYVELKLRTPEEWTLEERLLDHLNRLIYLEERRNKTFERLKTKHAVSHTNDDVNNRNQDLIESYNGLIFNEENEIIDIINAEIDNQEQNTVLRSGFTGQEQAYFLLERLLKTPSRQKERAKALLHIRCVGEKSIVGPDNALDAQPAGAELGLQDQDQNDTSKQNTNPPSSSYATASELLASLKNMRMVFYDSDGDNINFEGNADLQSNKSLKGLIESIKEVKNAESGVYNAGMSDRRDGISELIDTAPAFWADAPRSENPVAFIQRIYGTYLERDLFTQKLLRKLDPKLYKAFFNYCERKNLQPSDFVPNDAKRRDAILQQYNDLTFENSLGAAFKMAHQSDTVPSELVKRGEAYFTLLRRRQKTIKRSPS